MTDETTPPNPSLEDEAPAVFPDRRGGDRRKGERRRRQVPVEQERRSGEERRRGERRKRNINQYDMSAEELELANAVRRFREDASNRFPTVRELLGILRDLGYEKRT